MGFFRSLLLSESDGHTALIDLYRHYERAEQENPTGDPIDVLCRAWELFLLNVAPEREMARLPAILFSTTMTFACLEMPECGEALALFMLSQRRPDVVRKFPRFEQRYGNLMGDILADQLAENWAGLNARFNECNPHCTKQSPFPIGGESQYRNKLC